MKAGEKARKLEEILSSLPGALVAFSGGVDSTFLAYMARKVLGDRAVAVTALSETLPGKEAEEAARLAGQIGIRHLTITTRELEVEAFRRNAPDRCYHCKRELFGTLLEIAGKENLRVLDGSNADDTSDFRPGMAALGELGVLSPLRDAGLTKEDIRELSRKAGLPTWNRPSSACLSSRFPYGEPITREGLTRVARAEDFLKGLGLTQLRVRTHGPIARIEVPRSEFELLLGKSDLVITELKRVGYTYVTMDLEGFRSGSMNEILEEGEKKSYLGV